ncbi:hypothetical protein EVAR_93452_1 [Eumeta japonica]|uniref:GPR158/179 extracellular domain-containing protein n=1 Tax=Eumeta variegata TaxID=151549 RepID=A0A4C1TK57_EUMVA|nr:hypothetical protein EVAR_93452_1 [Eumeta japonica]
MPRFAPSAYRVDVNDTVYSKETSTPNLFHVEDLGAFDLESLSKDYTSDFYRTNEWYRIWLPDELDRRHDTKTTYQVEIRYANNTNETFIFHGARGNDEILGPVNWTRPYFDCGRLNRWMVAAVSPVVDIYPRHTQFKHIEYPTYTAAVVMEMDYDRIDINQCPPSQGNNGPNRFAGTARCKEETTECCARGRPIIVEWERRKAFGGPLSFGDSSLRYRALHFFISDSQPQPNLRRCHVKTIFVSDVFSSTNAFSCVPVHGLGFRRGGYQCRCKPGYRLPELVGGPYLGELVERANAEEYDKNFDCLKNGQIQRLPVHLKKGHPFVRDQVNDQHYEHVNVTTSPEILHTVRPNINVMLNFIKGVQPTNCSRRNSDLVLDVDIAHEAEEQFENQAKMAVRLANFISAFLQVSDSTETLSGKRVADKPISEDQIFGETFAIIMADSKIWSAGTYWDRNKFANRKFFAPCAFKTESNTRNYKIEDLARLEKTDEFYVDKDWFTFLKRRWSTNFDALEKFYLKIKVRDDEMGHYLRRHERYPTYYRAANLNHGHWTRPYYDCDGHLKQWVITYAAPFFGWDSVKVKLEFNLSLLLLLAFVSDSSKSELRPAAKSKFQTGREEMRSSEMRSSTEIRIEGRMESRADQNREWGRSRFI